MRGSMVRLAGCLCLVALSVITVGVAAAQDSIKIIVNDMVAEPIPDETAYQVTAYATVIGSNVQPITDLATELPPMLSLSGLDADAILTGSQKVRAVVSGKVEVVGVTFTLDGQPLAEVKKAPFEVVLDAAEISEGRHELAATANLADSTQLSETVAFEVRPVQPGSAVEVNIGGMPAASNLPGWATPAGIAAAVALVGVGGFALLRRKPRTQIIGGAAVALGRPGAAAGLTMDVAIGEKFATLAVLESLTLRKGQAFDLSGDVITIGRGADNGVIVPDALVSRNHAEIRRQDGEFRVFDLGSTYGTCVNDNRVESDGLPVRDGDTLRLGTRTTMIFNVIIPQTTGPEDRTIDAGAGALTGSNETIPAGILDIDEGGTIPVDISGVGDQGETIPAQVIIPREAGHDTEQARPPIIEETTEQPGDNGEEETEQPDMAGDDTLQGGIGEEDATLRSSD